MAGQDLNILFDGIFFSGQMPWIGVLFWSTFSTSLLFYLFVIAVLIFKLVKPLFRFVQWLDDWFALYTHPLRAVALGLILLNTCFFIAALFTRLL